jgi:hypothetical protein
MCEYMFSFVWLLNLFFLSHFSSEDWQIRGITLKRKLKTIFFFTLKISEKRHCEIDQSDKITIEDLIGRYAIEYYRTARNIL